MNKIFIGLFCLLIFGCSSSAQLARNASLTTPPALDASTSYPIDYDAYTVNVPEESSEGGVVANVMQATHGERISPIRQNQPATFDGVVFNGAALAFIEVEFLNLVRRCLIERRADQERLIARATTDLRHLQLRYDSETGIYRSIVSERDREITRLQNMVSNSIQPRLTTILYDALLFGGGIVFGAGIFALFNLLIP